MNPEVDWVDRAIQWLKVAFLMNKPAVICTHRLNYIGSIDKTNLEKGISLLDKLLKKVLKTFLMLNLYHQIR